MIYVHRPTCGLHSIRVRKCDMVAVLNSLMPAGWAAAQTTVGGQTAGCSSCFSGLHNLMQAGLQLRPLWVSKVQAAACIFRVVQPYTYMCWYTLLVHSACSLVAGVVAMTVFRKPSCWVPASNVYTCADVCMRHRPPTPHPHAVEPVDFLSQGGMGVKHRLDSTRLCCHPPQSGRLFYCM
jgi:hypothetical protein